MASAAFSPVVNAPAGFRAVRRWIAPTALLGFVFLAYAGSLSAPFIFDDQGAVVSNQTIRELFSRAVWHPPADGSTTTARPLLNISYALNYAIGGLRVFDYHVANVLIHALGAICLMALLRRTLATPAMLRAWPPGTTADAKVRGSVPFIAALLWALHPVQTESVICIAQRSESLCALFYLFTCYTFVRGAGAGRDGSPATLAQGRRWLAASVVACAAGMATKEVMVSAPLVVFLYDRTFLAGSFGGAWRARKRYYAALACTWLVLLWLVIGTAGGRGASAGVGLGVSSWDYLLTQCQALVTYLKLTVWPSPLVLDYGTGIVKSVADVWWRGAVIVLLLAWTAWAVVKRPLAGFAGACCFLVLAPSSSVMPLVTQTIAEHRMYLPLAALLGGGVICFARRFGIAVVWTAVGLALVFGGLTLARTRDYRDPLILWADTVWKFPTSARAHNNLGLVLQQRGDDAAAVSEFREAVALDSHYVTGFYNLGAALLRTGEIAQAVTALEQAVSLAAIHADAQLMLGNALLRSGQTAGAIEHFKAALALAPAADAHYNLGVAELTGGHEAEAAREFEAALALRANLPEAHHQLGRIAERRRDFTEAVQRYREALRFAPDHVDSHRRLGLIAAQNGDYPEAARHFSDVLRLDPLDADAMANLGNTALASGRPHEAIDYYARALRLRPGDARTEENLRLARESLASPSGR